MANEYTVESETVTQEEVKLLCDYYQSEIQTRQPGSYTVSRDYNLFNVNKLLLHNKQCPKWFNDLSIKLTKKSGYNILRSCYFLEYTKDSLCMLHSDNPKTVFRTAVTLLDRSDDIEGGDTIIIEQVDWKHDSSKVLLPKDSKETVTLKVPHIVKQPIGSTLWYDHNITHGVTRVLHGRRLVLISWFRS